MKTNTQKTQYLFLGVIVPFIYFFSPKCLSIAGVGPEWALLWLLPWAIEEGCLAGAFAGLCMGLVVDSISLDGFCTHIPAFVFLGYWWGLVGIKGLFSYKSFNLGLLACLGSLIAGLSIWMQTVFLLKNDSNFVFHAVSFHTVLAKTIMTGLIAPMICSILINRFFKKKI